jgi:hypothetical protein
VGQAARLFRGTAEQTLYGRVTPTDEQREFLQTQWNALADYLRDALAMHGYAISTWIQGSYKYATLIKPVHKGEEYDVDVGVYFAWSRDTAGATPTPSQLRDWVQASLLDYKEDNADVLEVEEPAKERCSRTKYEKQFHIDTPVYHLDPNADKRRLACLSDNWENSDPKALYLWFRGAVAAEKSDLLRRLVRYLKAWAAIAFENEQRARPSSTCLTVLATEAFQIVLGSQSVVDDDEDALVAVVGEIYARLSQDRRIKNPVDSTEDLSRIPADSWEAFIRQLTILYDAGRAASLAEDEVSAALAWERAFSFLMPLPETDELEVVDDSTGRALMQIPDIRIRVFDRRGGALVATFTNEVSSVLKDQWLQFEILNGPLVPRFASVAWTVRNGGDEADDVGDLGHAREGIGLLSVEEATKYIGKHYMDCVIRVGGGVYAARRVPVFIKPNIRSLRPKQNRNWMRLRTRRGRRG